MTIELTRRVAAPNSHRQRARLTHRGNLGRRRHGWLRLTPAYSLHLVEEILEEASAEDRVLDPFSGTGTTPLASAVAGISAHSVDINPFFVWLGNLKCTRFSDEDSEALREAAEDLTGRLPVEPSGKFWVPELHQIEKWWARDTLASLAGLFASIGEKRSQLRPAAVDLLKLAFCRTAIATSNAAFNHQSMSFKKAGGQSPPRSQRGRTALSRSRQRVAEEFAGAVALLSDGLCEDDPQAPARVFLGDSRELRKALPAQSYSRVVTSPPYPNRMSYIRELRPYMYWLGFLSSGREAGELDWRAIGGTWGCATSNLGSWSPNPEVDIPYPAFHRIVGEIAAEHQLLARYVHKYFEDIKAHIASLKTALAPGAKCHYVVGNSKFYCTLLPVEEIYAALFEEAGFEQVKIEQIRKRNSKKELYECIVHATQRS